MKLERGAQVYLQQYETQAQEPANGDTYAPENPLRLLRCFVKSRHCVVTDARRLSQAGGIALAVALLVTGALPAQAQTTNGAKPVSSAPTDMSPAAVKGRASYSVGLSIGTQLHSMGLNVNTLAYDRVVQGLKDALAGKSTFGPEDSQRVQTMIADVRNTEGAANKATAEKFLAQNAKQPGIITTASGLQYKVVRQGSGEPPKSNDTVTVNYRGTLLDGTEFDSSYKRGKPATFVFSQVKVIDGWKEAMLLMKPGSKVQMFIPPDLGYGMDPPPGPIPPGALLKFEVELLSVQPAPPAAPGGAMTGPKPPSPKP
jgi:FKBP-type peptidyl-prolyl cis-trans isomerase FklB